MNGLREPTIRKFNPGTFQSDDEVIRQFVVRERELGIVLEVLRGNVDSPSCQHLLLVAPRGRGKTMLLARVAAELRKDGELAAQLLPIRFMEESLEVLDPGDFWLETLFYLAAEVARRDPACAEELRRTRAALAAERRGGSVEERALAALLDAADRLDRKLVLMVENLQDLYGDTGDDFGWTLRKTLQTEPRIVLLATATGRFEGLDDTARPFFELFRTVPLHPLDAGECRRLWEAVGGEGRDARGIRPLQILTGGDPRLLVIVAGLARDRSLRRLMEELVSLIDEHTEYFRGHLDGFAKVERRVYLAVIDLWRPSSAGEIAARARLDIRTVSALLGRLAGRGAIVAEGDGAKRRYAAAQRLYGIYYKLRRERDEAAVVRNLIHFMAAFYEGGEWTEMSGALLAEAALSPVIREGVERAMAELPQLRERFAGLAPPDVERVSERAAANDEERAERRLDEIVAALLGERFEEVIRIASPLVDSRGGKQEMSVASALIAKAMAHRALGDADAAIAACDDVIERFGRSDAPALQAQVAMALLNKGVAQEERGDADAAIAACDDVVERFGRSDALELQAPVAVALVGKGVAQEERGDADAAIAAYDDVVERFGRSDALELQVQVAMALFNKGVAQGERGDADAAIAACDDVAERFGISDALELQAPVAMALFNKGVAQGERGDADAAIAAYDDVVERFGRSDALELQVRVAMALVGKGVAQVERGDANAAIAVWDDVVERFGRSDTPELQAQVAMALVGKGVAQGGRGDADAAIAVWDDVVERFGRSDAPALQLPVAMALVSKGAAQVERGDADAAIAACDDVVERFGSSDAPKLWVPVAMALVGRGEAQIRLGRTEDALRSLGEFERGFSELMEREGLAFGWRANRARTKALLAQGRRPAALEAFRSVHAALASGNEAMPGVMLELAPALIAAGVSERDLVGILSSDEEKSDALAPLIVALRRRAGEEVRAPAEVIEVADDVLRRIEEDMEHAIANRASPAH